jgi:hypothetical protein
MAKILSIFKSNDELINRQIPLVIDKSLTIIMQVHDVDLLTTSCSGCDKIYEEFMKNYSLLIIKEQEEDIYPKIKFKTIDLLNSIQQQVTCIGCKTSVEKYFKQISTIDNINYSLNPFNINVKDGYIYLSKDYSNPKSLYNIFYSSCSKLDKILVAKTKTNRRCFLHSLDSTNKKIKNINDWINVWELMDDECRNSILNVNKDDLIITINNYLKKHRFCPECKENVQVAFYILIGDYDSNKEKGYCAHLFDNLKIINNKYIQIKNDKTYITHLITLAEPEIHGSNREIHAKSIETAQEEVLTCVGIYLYDRFHRVYQIMKSEEQTWQLIFYIGIKHLKKCFECELECLKCQTANESSIEKAPIIKTPKKKKIIKKKKLLNNIENELVDSCLSSTKNHEYELECLKCETANKSGVEKATKKNDGSKSDTGYSRGQESNISSINQQQQQELCICQENDELIITKPKICICDEIESIIEYLKIIVNASTEPICEDDKKTDEEKNEYYANKKLYFYNRKAYRAQLKEKFENFKFLNFKIKPRIKVQD